MAKRKPSIFEAEEADSRAFLEEVLSIGKEGLLSLNDEDLAALTWRTEWLATARDNQLPPPGDWTTWMVLAGRGYGKTKLGTEDVGWYGYTHPGTRIAIVGRTAADVRDTCFEGISGLCSVIPPILVKDYHRSLNELVLKNGSRFKGYSAEEPDKLRGPQAHRALCDELASWANAEETWDNLMFGLRLGDAPKAIVTTTPKPVDLVRRLANDPTVTITRGSTYENRENLAATFFDQIAQYEGTEIGRQEIHGELIDPEEHGIFKRSWFRLWPKDKPFPKFEYLVMSMDTAFTEKTLNDPTACTIWGVFKGLDTDSYGWNVLLCDAWSAHLIYADLRKRAESEYRSLYGDPGRYPDIVLVEQKGSGITLCQDLRIAGIPVRPYNPGNADKVQRAHRISYLVANGLCWLPESTLKQGRPRDWCEDFLTQVCTFPLSKRFDYVDTFTQALHLLADQSWLRLERSVSEYEDEPEERTNPYAA